MSSHTKQTSAQDDIKNRVSQLLDQAVATALGEAQFDAFFEKTAARLRQEDENCIPVITRRILRADYREKEILLQVLKNFRGMEHIQFLQDMLDREVITARMGRIILDIFNKSDMILESGTATRLLDLDAISQKIIHSVLLDSIDAPVLDLFISRPAREQEGILVDLLAETGPKSALFLSRLYERDNHIGRAMLKLAASETSEASYRLLSGMYEITGDKDFLKGAKKTAHALRQKGIEVGQKQEKESRHAVFKTAELPSPRAFATMIDAEGFQLLFMLKPVSAHEIKIFNIMLSQEKGLHDIEVITALRRETKQLVTNLLTDNKIEFLEIPASHAAFLLSEATALTSTLGGILSPVLVQWNQLFAELLPPPEHPAIYDLLSPQEIRGDRSLADSSLELLDYTEIPYWFIATQAGLSVWRAVANQAEAQPEEVLRQAALLFFTVERLRSFARKLEEQAFILHLKGRQNEAKIAFAAALDLTGPELAPSAHPLCREIIKRGIEYFSAREKKPGASSARA